MNKTEVQIIALSTSESSPGSYSLVLEELKGNRRLPIIIGAFEAQSIAIHLERMEVDRPLTHDLLKSVITSLGATLKEVFIHSRIDSTYHASLILLANGTETVVDARSSDALSLAVRFDCPIFIESSLIDNLGILPEAKKYSLLKGSLAEYSLDQLEELLNDLLAKEDYESASRVRDMISRRKNG